MGMPGSQEPGRHGPRPRARLVAAGTNGGSAQLLWKNAALGLLFGVLLTRCGSPPPPPVQISPAALARQAPAPIQISPRVAEIYSKKYLSALRGDTSAVFVLSPNGNRFEYRFCRHPDCQLSDDELAARAIARCNIGVPQQDPAQSCLVFDRDGKVNQPYRTWSDGDFDTPVPAPPVLTVKNASELAP